MQELKMYNIHLNIYTRTTVNRTHSRESGICTYAASVEAQKFKTSTVKSYFVHGIQYYRGTCVLFLLKYFFIPSTNCALVREIKKKKKNESTTIPLQ